MKTEEETKRPEIVTDEHLTYLDELRESGKTNMFGAGEYLSSKFTELANPVNAKKVLLYWMKNFGAR